MLLQAVIPKTNHWTVQLLRTHYYPWSQKPVNCNCSPWHYWLTLIDFYFSQQPLTDHHCSQHAVLAENSGLAVGLLIRTCTVTDHRYSQSDQWSPLFPTTSVLTDCNHQGLALITIFLNCSCFYSPFTHRYCSPWPITDHQFSQTSPNVSIPSVFTDDYCFRRPRPSDITGYHCPHWPVITIVRLTQRLIS